MNWNGLRFLLALHRAGSLMGAGAMLRTSETTVSRRIRSLESALDTRLMRRHGANAYQLTADGLAMIPQIEAMERASRSIDAALSRPMVTVRGVVRISAVSIIVNRILVPAAVDLRQNNPDLTLEFVTEDRNISLSKREADLALRFARPEAGGLKTATQRLGSLGFGAYEALGSRDAEHSWIGYDDGRAHLPQARWMNAAGFTLALRVSDAETALEAAAAGLGRTLLPRRIGDSDPRLQQASHQGNRPLPTRDVWLLSHRDDQDHPAIDQVKAWLRGLSWQ